MREDEAGSGDAGGERLLGVIECFTATRDQCPSGAVQRVARQGLEVIGREGASALPMQAFILLTAIRGWKGDRARQVRASLERYLAEQEGPGRSGASGGAGGSGP
jgi:hypothetical protein